MTPLFASLVVETVIGLVVFFGLILLARRLLGALASPSTGGWKVLQASWATDAPPPTGSLRRETVRVGHVFYRRCATVGTTDEGLHIELSGVARLFSLRPLRIPWTAMTERRPTRLYMRPATEFLTASPADTTVVLYDATCRRLGIPC